MSTLHEALDVLLTGKASYFDLNTQSEHRLNILQSWLQIGQENGYGSDLESNITGKKILDIGCGQGDMVELFASVLKTQGHEGSKVIGVDPARLDYGELV
jgi:ubiquinone/menaquinone biosynthesis C-methylase UbiE